ncbi:NnrS family protein [Cerasicoccus arenae]|uniref:NnrS family protein n=1 Tax=Cerasicoccus arenae TaxID=424488 RepID=A0A8J3DA73_9BACT|nr:NnrS family protein [Cerasicoccus arenae]MBK1859174.1 NnrS family protein [Cerasicoccus arenae]GHC01068.1 hypothetical protein GCM10007047_16840 [Cerasicoccus arenae]
MPNDNASQPSHSSFERPGYWKLVAAGEPYRLLFVVGSVLGLLGIGLWPAYALKWIDFYPGLMHARIMIEGFLTCFVVGFLGTAFPRLLDVKRFSLEESLTWTVALITASLCHLFGNYLWGDFLFTLSILLLVYNLLTRFASRKDTPPPGFILVMLGMLCALFGGTLQVVIHLSPDGINYAMSTFSRLALNQGYLLLPVMGIGAFLIPRFFGLPNRQNFPESKKLPVGWIPRALFALFCGILVLASFVLEANNYLHTGYSLRAFAILLYFFRELPIHQAKFNQGALALSIRIALISIPLGYILMAIWPERQAAFIHVVFISGFSLLTFIVASRVILGHSGQSHMFRKNLKSVYALLALMCLAMLTRVSADWLPSVRMNHLGYAAATWMIAVILWGTQFFKYLSHEDCES